MWRTMQTLVSGVCVATLSVSAFAANEPAAKSHKAGAKAEKNEAKGESVAETEIRKALEQIIDTPGAIQSVHKTSYGNFYEGVLANGDIVYIDPTGAFLISGSLIDIKARKNVTSARLNELQRIDFSDLPLANAIKQVRGNGKRMLVTFEDPNCSYCKKLAKDMISLKDTTIYTFMIPILAPDSADKSRAIWCASDRAKAWNDWMVDGKLPTTATCDNPIAKNADLAHKLRISGTPTMFLIDGNRLGGYMALAELDKAINDAGAAATAKK
ncbi:MAG: thiol:disulfide interchange protein [Rhodocyclales bacterium]|nr:thiol:disulfide interchange protein [Rhodocyclales bacterium]